MTLTDQVVDSFGGDDRLSHVMRSLVRHLHAFAEDVRLTEAEWAKAIDFLTRTGHITDDRRQEFILLSDVLGLSMLTVALNGSDNATVFGPFFVEGAPEVPLGGDITGDAHGVPCWVSGTVRSKDGTPIPDARIDVWEADDNGLYDVQRDGGVAGRGRLRSGPDGGYRFWSVRPSPYPIPMDGPVGELLAKTGRGPMRPAHIHFKVEAPGYRPLITHVFAAGDPYLETDAVFGVREGLVTTFEEHQAGVAPDGRELTGPWASVEFDLVLTSGGDH
ncbi:6-chlorohydroxyquinol-1,2-dioxygenase [Lentzea sp. NBRC 105346]|uniref:dioxygenase family protein n=1 Tax=Lentzea sp. NBRC 105346 TaxID=3032205 RepID=UPI0024A4FB29|nr:dioxygenase [Lentzea sp. NBRC 105346]GLZ28668.1 6-chlorohydroxyquinol-1,2-dioxygenase [Lentzea sp. NBRC 105346]